MIRNEMVEGLVSQDFRASACFIAYLFTLDHSPIPSHSDLDDFDHSPMLSDLADFDQAPMLSDLADCLWESKGETEYESVRHILCSETCFIKNASYL